MNENENNFESLRRLLALKRHEVPPPGYFENFSSQVTARIRAGEDRATEEQQGIELPWFFRLLSAFEAKPAFAGAFASALCLLLVFGIFVAERPDSVTQPLLAQSQPDSSGVVSPIPPVSPSGFSTEPAGQSGFFSSTNPVPNTQLASSQLGGMFFGQPSPTIQPVSFKLPEN